MERIKIDVTDLSFPWKLPSNDVTSAGLTQARRRLARVSGNPWLVIRSN
jgi:hypothetical protein